MLALIEHGGIQALEWLKSNEHLVSFEEDKTDALFSDVARGIEGYLPFIAAMVAAAESGEAEYAGQLGWIDSIYSPPAWQDTGSMYLASFPKTVLFIMQSGSGEAAYRLAATKVSDKYAREAKPIYDLSEVNGWPDSLGHRCTTAWQFLDTRIDTWPWIKEAFGSIDACRSAMTGYYMLMNFLNFLAAVKTNSVPPESAPNSGGFVTTVALCCLHWPEPVVAGGYKLLSQQRDVLDRIIKSNGLDRQATAALWPRWMKETGRWLGNVYQSYWNHGFTPHRMLFDEWDKDPFNLD